MDVEQKNQLKSAMYKVIGDEGLPFPYKIYIRSPLFGIRRSAGCCRRSILNRKYSIVVSTTKVRFVSDSTGEYVNRVTKERLRRLLGSDINNKDVVHTAVHEIAHLKFWNHSPEHYSYTEHLFLKLCEELRWEFV